jgi:hypothetical protein
VCASRVNCKSNCKHVTERHYKKHMRWCHVLAACAGSQIPLCHSHSSIHLQPRNHRTFL